MIYVGIDPGLDGGVAIIRGGNDVELHDTPSATQKRGKASKRRSQPALMARLLSGVHILPPDDGIIVALESVSAMPGQGVVSMFAMGRGLGQWEGILGALCLPVEYVTPQVWKRGFGLLGCDKNASIAKAQQLFPACAGMLTRKKDHGRAEALLIAEYLRRARATAPTGAVVGVGC